MCDFTKDHEAPPHTKAICNMRATALIYFIGGRRHSGCRAMSLGPSTPRWEEEEEEEEEEEVDEEADRRAKHEEKSHTPTCRVHNENTFLFVWGPAFFSSTCPSCLSIVDHNGPPHTL